MQYAETDSAWRDQGSYAMHSKALGIPTYIIASNRLAGKYLVHLLAKHPFARPILCEQLPQPRLRSRLTVFVLEGSFVPLPLRECLRRLRLLFSKGRFIVVNRAQPDEEIMRLLTLGVHGFVEHSRVAEALADAVRMVAAGHLWIPKGLLQAHVQMNADATQRSAGGFRSLTPREMEVLELVRHRLSNKEIAEVLRVRESTVKYHLSHMLAKLRVGGRRELDSKANTARIWEELSS